MLVIGLGGDTAGPAAAAGSKPGSRVCNPGMVISASSNTSKLGKPLTLPFAVGHIVLGAYQKLGQPLAITRSSTTSLVKLGLSLLTGS